MYRFRLSQIVMIASAMILHQASYFVQSQPILLNPASMVNGQMLAMPLVNPMMYGPQALDPYSASMQIPQYLMAASPFGGMMPAHLMPISPYDTVGRRSAGRHNLLNPQSSQPKAGSHQQQRESPELDDQKAMEDLPVNFVSISTDSL